MSEMEDNISDFDEDEDDPDHMAIPGAPLLASKPFSVSTPNHWNGNINTLAPVSGVVSSAFTNTSVSSPSNVRLQLVTTPNAALSASSCNIQPVQHSNPSVLSNNFIRAQAPLMLPVTKIGIPTTLHAPGIRLPTSSFTPQTVQVVRPGPVTVKVSANGPRFQVIKSGTNTCLNKIVPLNTSIATSSNAVMKKIVINPIVRPISLPPVIDLTDSNPTNCISLSTTKLHTTSTSVRTATVQLTPNLSVPSTPNIIINNISTISPGSVSKLNSTGNNKVFRILTTPTSHINSSPLTGTTRLVTRTASPIVLGRVSGSGGAAVLQTPPTGSRIIRCPNVKGVQMLNSTVVVTSSGAFVQPALTSTTWPSISTTSSSSTASSTSTRDNDLLSAALVSSGADVRSSNGYISVIENNNTYKTSLKTSNTDEEVSASTVHSCSTSVSSVPPKSASCAMAALPQEHNVNVALTLVSDTAMPSTTYEYEGNSIFRDQRITGNEEMQLKVSAKALYNEVSANAPKPFRSLTSVFGHTRVSSQAPVNLSDHLHPLHGLQISDTLSSSGYSSASSRRSASPCSVAPLDSPCYFLQDDTQDDSQNLDAHAGCPSPLLKKVLSSVKNTTTPKVECDNSGFDLLSKLSFSNILVSVDHNDLLDNMKKDVSSVDTSNVCYMAHTIEHGSSGSVNSGSVLNTPPTNYFAENELDLVDSSGEQNNLDLSRHMQNSVQLSEGLEMPDSLFPQLETSNDYDSANFSSESFVTSGGGTPCNAETSLTTPKHSRQYTYSEEHNENILQSTEKDNNVNGDLESFSISDYMMDIGILTESCRTLDNSNALPGLVRNSSGSCASSHSIPQDIGGNKLNNGNETHESQLPINSKYGGYDNIHDYDANSNNLNELLSFDFLTYPLSNSDVAEKIFPNLKAVHVESSEEAFLPCAASSTSLPKSSTGISLASAPVSTYFPTSAASGSSDSSASNEVCAVSDINKALDLPKLLPHVDSITNSDYYFNTEGFTVTPSKNDADHNANPINDNDLRTSTNIANNSNDYKDGQNIPVITKLPSTNILKVQQDIDNCCKNKADDSGMFIPRTSHSNCAAAKLFHGSRKGSVYSKNFPAKVGMGIKIVDATKLPSYWPKGAQCHGNNSAGVANSLVKKIESVSSGVNKTAVKIKSVFPAPEFEKCSSPVKEKGSLHTVNVNTLCNKTKKSNLKEVNEALTTLLKECQEEREKERLQRYLINVQPEKLLAHKKPNDTSGSYKEPLKSSDNLSSSGSGQFDYSYNVKNGQLKPAFNSSLPCASNKENVHLIALKNGEKYRSLTSGCIIANNNKESKDCDDDIVIVYEKNMQNSFVLNTSDVHLKVIPKIEAKRLASRKDMHKLIIVSKNDTVPTTVLSNNSFKFNLKQGNCNNPVLPYNSICQKTNAKPGNIIHITNYFANHGPNSKSTIESVSFPLADLGRDFQQKIRGFTKSNASENRPIKLSVKTGLRDGGLKVPVIPDATLPDESSSGQDLLRDAMMESGVFDLGLGGASSTATPATVSSSIADVNGITVSIPGLNSTVPVPSLVQQPALPLPITTTTQPPCPIKFTIQTATPNQMRSVVTVTTSCQLGGSTVMPITRPLSTMTVPLTTVRMAAPTGISASRMYSPISSMTGSLLRTSSGVLINTGQLVRPPGQMRMVGPGGTLVRPPVFNMQMHLEEMEDDDGAMGIAETFANYKPSKLKYGRSHPDPVVESASLASVEPPNIVYHPRLPPEVVDSGRLSALQLETITYVGQKHACFLPDGNRAGFLVGDGAGVGKGRTIAGIIIDNYLQGRKKSIWVSASNDLKYDAERDLQDIGASNIKVRFLSKMKYSKIRSDENGNMKKGVLFATYSALIGESSNTGRYSTRMKQILEWCGHDFDGCIIFDECHRAKNLCPVESGKPTKTGLTVLELQKKLASARIVYASATGASEPKNMAYMVRLGLWGKGTPFKSFSDFISTVEKRGVGAMEIVAMDMKLRGMYIARQLSFHGVTFRIEEAPLTPEFKRIYNDSVLLWVRAKEYFQEAANLLTAESNVKKSMWGQFWSAHQRFFKYMCIASKVEMAVKLGREAVKSNCRCVVIGLQSTGEARTLEQLEKDDGELSDFVSTAKGVLETLVEKHFPASNAERVNRVLALARKKTLTHTTKRKKSQQSKASKKSRMESGFMSSNDEDSDESFDEDEIDNICDKFVSSSCDLPLSNGSAGSRPRSRTTSPLPEATASVAVTSQEAIDKARSLKDRLLRQIQGLGKRLPPNTLDQLIDELGGPDNVAEMTGRKGRIVQSDYGNIAYETRAAGDVAQEMLNLAEKEKFMSGEKLVAIISEAASSGISLQSDKRVLNQKRRVHITLELPWSADRAIQQFGRTHRSNQVSAPEYVFLISELAGERRFASIVAKRLESMGALTHGDRRTADTRDLSSFNIDNQYGRDALLKTMNCIMGFETSTVSLPLQYDGDFILHVKPALVGVGLASRDALGNFCLEKEGTNMTKFLNRILGMPVDLQNALFQYFTDTLTSITTQAKKAGRFDKGILDLCVGADGCKSEPVMQWKSRHSTGDAKTVLHELKVERGMSWQQALEKAPKLTGNGEGFYLSKRIRNSRQAALLAILDPGILNSKRAKSDQLYSIYRPNLGLVVKQERFSDLRKKYNSTSADDARDHWEEQYTQLATTCAHVFWTGSCPRVATIKSKCEYGLRVRTYHVLGGSVLNVWSSVEEVLATDPQAPRFQRLQVVRFKTRDKVKHVGTLIPNNMVSKVRAMLTAESASTTLQSSDSNSTGSSAPHYFNGATVDDDDDDDIIMLA